jgi:hypothetical protein
MLTINKGGNMKTAAFLTPLLMSKQNSVTQSPMDNKGLINSGGGFSNIQPSLAGRDTSRKAWSFLDGLEDFGDKIKPENFSNFHNSKEKISPKALQELLAKQNDDSLITAYKSGGANPDLEFDIKSSKGAIISSDNNMGHLIANELSKEDGMESRILSLFAVAREFATSGGDLSKKNSDGLSPIELVEGSKGPYKGEMAHLMKNLKAEQMNHHVAIGDYVYSGPQQHSSYDDPTSQMLNLVSQSYNKLSNIGEGRVAKLIESGADLDIKLGTLAKENRDTNLKENDNRTLIDVAVKNWGKNKAAQLFEMSNAVKIHDYIVESSEQYLPLVKGTEQEHLQIKREESALNRVNEAFEVFYNNKVMDKSSGLSR